MEGLLPLTQAWVFVRVRAPVLIRFCICIHVGVHGHSYVLLADVRLVPHRLWCPTRWAGRQTMLSFGLSTGSAPDTQLLVAAI